jgi:lysophosphatidylcholine acyltransferase / lyso-PAF acetyltransferase
MEEVFLPFVRTDKYGDNGERPQPLLSRLLVSVAAVTILPLKLVGTLTCLISFNSVCHIASVLPESRRHHVIAELGKIHCRACLFCLGFLSIKWVTIQSPSKTTRPAPAGIVSNHMGWSDILIHMSRSFPSFVAREGTQNIPFVGFIR